MNTHQQHYTPQIQKDVIYGLPTSAVTVGKIAKKTVLILDITERLFTAGVLYSSLWPVVTTFLISQKGYWQLGTSTVHCGQW